MTFFYIALDITTTYALSQQLRSINGIQEHSTCQLRKTYVLFLATLRRQQILANKIMS